ncbi:cystatin-like [Pantherophis guttatus]|uniref:Cystatin-like n=1 Tax=Pantherophis guttatus TaxID=94885 RepID=A0ABM3YR75_PANGU|nr:cystatin-like [Pantherophis guttatus]
MERSRLPLLSLLGLFGALLMLSPELLLGIDGCLSDVPVTDPRLQKVLAFSLDLYNRCNHSSMTYFKVLRILGAQWREKTRDEYHVSVELMETTCKKWPHWPYDYEEVQKCEQVPGNQKKLTCYFKVIHALSKMELAVNLL